MISPDDLSLFRLTDDPQVAVAEILQFFRVYHSMRYVKDQLVLRLQKRPSESLLQEINSNFKDILDRGEFQLTDPLPMEADQPELKHLARLVFHFDRRSLGRLRQLIDCLNRGNT